MSAAPSKDPVGAAGATKGSANPLRRPRVEKVVINIGVGEAGDRLVKAEQVLTMVTGQKPVRTISKTTNKELAIRLGMPIGVKVTLRGPKALEFLKTALWTKENQLPSYSFDAEGNFSFGVPEYTDFPGQKYDPDIGIFGLDVCVTLTRLGTRLRRRSRQRRSLPRRQRLTPAETRVWAQEHLAVKFFGEGGSKR